MTHVILKVQEIQVAAVIMFNLHKIKMASLAVPESNFKVARAWSRLKPPSGHFQRRFDVESTSKFQQPSKIARWAVPI